MKKACFFFFFFGAPGEIRYVLVDQMWWNMVIREIFLNRISTPARARGSFCLFGF